jgi:NADPH-dependent 2,4-dienoyl-CoA reductase/sulfur reductase-like enzyme
VTVAIVGAGLAGVRTAEALRQEGYAGRVVLVGAEAHAPYSRPPLSKEVLRGDAEPDAATLRSPAELAALDVELRLGTVATALSVAGRELTLSDGSTLRYDDAVLACGARPRALPGVTMDGVHLLRTVDDCLALRDVLRPDQRVVVVGAGFIGLEVAASARARGCAVTVVDVLPAPLARVLDVAVGAAVQRLHENHGVAFRCGVGVAAVEGSDRVERVVLADGTVLDADVVVVGIGVEPATGWLDGAGLTLDDGVVCDEALRAAPGVWVVGDVARWRPAGTAGTVRLEHWTNATEQPQCVARSIVTGEAQPFTTVPYFWSDQYDAKLQSLGTETLGEETRVVWGSLDEPKWVALVRAGDRLGAVVGMRAPGRVMKLRPLLAEGASWQVALDATLDR